MGGCGLKRDKDRAWMGGVVALAIVAAALIWGINDAPASEADAAPVVVVDAGHGGVDGGASGSDGTLESDVNYDIAMKVKALLEDAGCRVVLTRNQREGIIVDGVNISTSKSKDMAQRKNIIRKSGADLIISIHQNAFPDERCYGAQVFYQVNTKAQDWANSIQDAFAAALQDGNRRRPQQGDYFIRVGGIPAVLVECGFLSHPQEGRRLLDSAYQQKIAQAIVDGTLSWWQAENASVIQ